LQEHKTRSQVKMSSLKCCVAKSAAQISIQFSDTSANDYMSHLQDAITECYVQSSFEH